MFYLDLWIVFLRLFRFLLDLCFAGVVLIISNWIFDFLFSFPLLISDLWVFIVVLTLSGNYCFQMCLYL